MNRTQFTFYESFYKALTRIRRDADRAKAYDAITRFALYGEEPDIEELPDAVAIAFEVIKPNLTASRKKSEAGKKGGEANAKQRGSNPEANAKQEKEQVQVQVQEQDKEQMFIGSPDPASGPPVVQMPLNDGSEYPVYEAQITEWSSLYPAVDVRQELNNMIGWLKANPTRRKTKSGINRFINNWLAREQDRGQTQRPQRREPHEQSSNPFLEIAREEEARRNGQS